MSPNGGYREVGCAQMKRAVWMMLGAVALAAFMMITGCNKETSATQHPIRRSTEELSSVADKTIEMTVVCDNYEHVAGLETSWGFACVIDTPQKSILFDTSGDGAILLGNMEKLNISPQDIDMVVISHDHWDHTGGVREFLARNSQVPVYVVSAFSPGTKQLIKTSGGQLIEVSQPREIAPGVFSTGQVPGAPPEQALVVQTDEGLVVVTGCAHPGVVNMVKAGMDACEGNVHLVMGGFHMAQSSARQIHAVIDQLRELGVEKAAPCHCSGGQTRQLFAEELGEDFIRVGVGARLKFSYSHNSTENRK